MRQVARPALPGKAKPYLDSQLARIDAARHAGPGPDIDRHWNTARKTKTVRELLGLLQNAMGPTQRCMYCVDSHGSDIEHFWPKAAYPAKAFEWSNWLLCCTECGRIKGNRFPLDAAGHPMLVDPTVDDPWDFLDFDPATGNIVARYDTTSSAPMPRGVETVRVLALDAREGLAEAYKRSFRRLAKVVRDVLAAGRPDTPQLIAELQEKDDHGLLGWCFSTRGATCRPFEDLRKAFPVEWTACASALA